MTPIVQYRSVSKRDARIACIYEVEINGWKVYYSVWVVTDGDGSRPEPLMSAHMTLNGAKDKLKMEGYRG